MLDLVTLEKRSFNLRTRRKLGSHLVRGQPLQVPRPMLPLKVCQLKLGGPVEPFQEATEQTVDGLLLVLLVSQIEILHGLLLEHVAYFRLQLFVEPYEDSVLVADLNLVHFGLNLNEHAVLEVALVNLEMLRELLDDLVSRTRLRFEARRLLQGVQAVLAQVLLAAWQQLIGDDGLGNKEEALLDVFLELIDGNKMVFELALQFFHSFSLVFWLDHLVHVLDLLK